MKKGDTIRFLNAKGGGRISRIEEKKGLVYVEDDSGFEIPALIREVIVVDNVSETTNVPKRQGYAPREEKTSEKPASEKVGATPEQQPVLETPDGDNPTVLLAFFPLDIKHLQSSSYECYLVNDSNYYLYYNMVIGPEDNRRSVAHGEIEPNMQEYVATLQKEVLNDWEQLRIQAVALKKGKPYAPQSAIDVNVRLNAVKFYKLHSFTSSDYFDEPAMLVDVLAERDGRQQPPVTPETIKEGMLSQKQSPAKPRKSVGNPRKNAPAVVEVDLHIGELLDTTAGMSNADMLQCQLDKFHTVMEEYKDKTGQKIVFIHGKGEGVLRKEIEKQLKTKYRHVYFQDASFREYGFGATMVTIRKKRS